MKYLIGYASVILAGAALVGCTGEQMTEPTNATSSPSRISDSGKLTNMAPTNTRAWRPMPGDVPFPSHPTEPASKLAAVVGPTVPA